MKIISTKVHGYLDYFVGVFLIVMPWLFGFAEGRTETWVPVILGGATIIYSLFTRYELGVYKKLSMSAHLAFDIVSGIMLASSPWLFGFAEGVWLPHLVLGLMEISVASLTVTYPLKPKVNSTAA